MNKNYGQSSPEPTLQAKRLANELTRLGLKCELEKWDGYKHIDISITKAFLNIEIDGAHHNLDREQARRDIDRTYYSFIKSYNTIRIPNSILKEDQDIRYTAQRIKDMIDKKPKYYHENYSNKIKAEKDKYKIIIAALSGILILLSMILIL